MYIFEWKAEIKCGIRIKRNPYKLRSVTFFSWMKCSKNIVNVKFAHLIKLFIHHSFEETDTDGMKKMHRTQVPKVVFSLIHSRQTDLDVPTREAVIWFMWIATWLQKQVRLK